jgi:hypothetical protein
MYGDDVFCRGYQLIFAAINPKQMKINEKRRVTPPSMFSQRKNPYCELL